MAESHRPEMNDGPPPLAAAGPKVWLVGARGMLGHEIADCLASRNVRHETSDLDCDITDIAAVRSFAATASPDVILNCAAYTAVDRAEGDEEKAYAINATGPKNLGIVGTERGATVIHVSTDYVFDGRKTTPYLEDDPLAPQSAYGRTKAAGETLLREACPRSVIVRTAWLYGAHGPNFVETMLRLFATREEVSVVADQHGTPTYAPDLAAALVTVSLSGNPSFGAYHFTNAGETTWFGFASRIRERARALGILSQDCRLRPITTAEYPTSARRPAWSILDKTKLVRTFGVELRCWEEGLDEYLAQRTART
jgi:dTDP-4-dehydrorhamnose reductase